jgi:hypothetical protein
MVLTQANNGNLTWVAIAIGKTAQSVNTEASQQASKQEKIIGVAVDVN